MIVTQQCERRMNPSIASCQRRQCVSGSCASPIAADVGAGSINIAAMPQALGGGASKAVSTRAFGSA